MDVPLLKIKICGITTPEDGLLVAEAGADAVGLNFYEPSPRYVTIDRAVEITQALPESVVTVGLFVNAPMEQILQCLQQVPLDIVQLHGDETPEFLQQLHEKSARQIIRAFRLGPNGLGSVLEYLDACHHLGALPDMVILDAYRRGAYGGTGQTTDWEAAAQFARIQDRPRLLLAGGLSPKNVTEAICQVQPDGVDTASGVESSLGRKDQNLVQRFVAMAKPLL